MFGPVQRNPGRLEVIERLTQWTRERFGLPRGAVVSVSEIACSLPGCPPLETVVLFWIAEQPYQFRLFKPLGQVVVDDLPYSWLRDALAVEERVGSCC